jgi:hypothetical protein
MWFEKCFFLAVSGLSEMVEPSYNILISFSCINCMELLGEKKLKFEFYYSCIHSIPCSNEMSFSCMSIICGPTCVYVCSLSFTLHKTKHKDNAERFYHKYIT